MAEDYRYCPNCRAEYRAGFDVCSDCDVPLIDELPPEPTEPEAVMFDAPTIVFVTGNHVEADVVCAMLQGCGLEAKTGMGKWRGYTMASEISGVPSILNAH